MEKAEGLVSTGSGASKRISQQQEVPAGWKSELALAIKAEPAAVWGWVWRALRDGVA